LLTAKYTASAITAARATPRTITANWYQRMATRDGGPACFAMGVVVGVAVDMLSALRAVDHASTQPDCSGLPGLWARSRRQIR
jgi:hypothetical protein